MPLSELMDLASAAATATVELLAEKVGGDLHVITKSTSSDLVTQVDREAEELIVEVIRSSRPDDAILGEEGTGVTGSSGVEWIIDPIDGTTNFVYGHPGFCVSIAAAVEGDVQVGVVGDPLLGDVFTATVDEGARRNGSPIVVTEATHLSEILVATGFGYDVERRREQGAVIAELLPLVADIRRVGSAALDLCSVACGRVDAYFERGLNRWDYAAGALIASEAGAIVSDLAGGQPGKRFTFAAAPGIAVELEHLLRELKADGI